MKYNIADKRTNAVWINSNSIDLYHRVNAESYRVNFIEKMALLESTKSIRKITTLDTLTNFISHITGFETEKYITYVNQGIPFFRIVNLNPFFIEYSDVKFIPNAIYDALPKYHLQKSDILLSKDGSIGIAAIFNKSDEKAMASSHVVTIRTEEDKIDPHFLVTFLNSEYCQIQCENLSTGSIQKALNVAKIRNLLVPIPAPEIQTYIGDKVRKAEQLREEANTLGKLAKVETDKIIETFCSGKFSFDLAKKKGFDQDVESLIEGTFDMSKITEPESAGKET